MRSLGQLAAILGLLSLACDKPECVHDGECGDTERCDIPTNTCTPIGAEGESESEAESEGERLPQGSACDDPADCASGFCADEVCCATACDGPCDEGCSAEGVCRRARPGTDPNDACPGDGPCVASAPGESRWGWPSLPWTVRPRGGPGRGPTRGGGRFHSHSGARAPEEPVQTARRGLHALRGRHDARTASCGTTPTRAASGRLVHGSTACVARLFRGPIYRWRSTIRCGNAAHDAPRCRR